MLETGPRQAGPSTSVRRLETPAPEFHQLDQGRTRITWHASPDDSEAEVQLTRPYTRIQHQINPDPAMDDAFPWRDPHDPTRRVYAPYAAEEDGTLHPDVRARAREITAKMGTGRAIIKQLARQDERLRSLRGSVNNLHQTLWPQLETEVAAEVAGWSWESHGPSGRSNLPEWNWTRSTRPTVSSSASGARD